MTLDNHQAIKLVHVHSNKVEFMCYANLSTRNENTFTCLSRLDRTDGAIMRRQSPYLSCKITSLNITVQRLTR